MRVDVGVIGGGPAGMATALALVRRGFSVTVIERYHYEHRRVGETLPPAARKLLTDLGVWERFLQHQPLPSFGVYSAWGGPDTYSSDFIWSPYGCGWHLNRAGFDGMLSEAAADAGVRVLLGARALSCDVDCRGNWQIAISSGGELLSIRVRRVVDATGRASVLGRQAGARRLAYDRLVGIVGFFAPASSGSRCENSTLIEAIRDGWWYSAPLPDSGIVVALMTDGDLYSRACRGNPDGWQKQLRAASHTYARVRGRALECGLCVRSANSSRLNRIAGDKWLAVGEAATTFDPLSGQGILKALDSGVRAAISIEASLAGRTAALGEYATREQRSFDSYLGWRGVYYSRERRWVNHPFWQRRAAESSLATS